MSKRRRQLRKTQATKHDQHNSSPGQLHGLSTLLFLAVGDGRVPEALRLPADSHQNSLNACSQAGATARRLASAAAKDAGLQSLLRTSSPWDDLLKPFRGSSHPRSPEAFDAALPASHWPASREAPSLTSGLNISVSIGALVQTDPALGPQRPADSDRRRK